MYDTYEYNTEKYEKDMAFIKKLEAVAKGDKMNNKPNEVLIFKNPIPGAVSSVAEAAKITLVPRQ